MEKISQIQTPIIQNQSIAKPQTENKTEGFSEIFKKQLEEVNKLQNTSDKLTQQLVTGEVEDVSQVMVAAQKASLSLQLTVQVRNKVVEAYQEVMRMQL
ncbi:Flagellar hook-basal body complex protein FliE [Planococcus massiliensis]|uniref:Flagellar hook-basal body complex protein FliE n=1 Tax=Planococcus massiliensis TaxID=1499687 RepID=A0A098EPX0_9BACL|nr:MULTISPECIES: flagellar hook-basal body complex protein FliE [Planococcus]MCJ1909769.1 flagellar hook-basal body complex protein FliE [Planococcus ruber]CEG24339.1 Flagellar hook-basal body complex protein FliE [Planococcus massiliensis]